MHVLREMLFDVDENEQQLVFGGGQGRILVGGVAAVEPRESINRIGLHTVQKTALEHGHQGSEFVWFQAGERSDTRFIVRDILVS